MHAFVASAVERLRRLGCTPAEAAAVAILAVGALAALGLLWLLARPRPAPPASSAPAVVGPGAGPAVAGGPAAGGDPAAAGPTAGPLAPVAGALPPTAATSTPATGSGPSPSPAPPITVHVAGLVADPGVYTLGSGARVADAVDAAGGPLPKAVLDGLNLARPLTDGEQVVVTDDRPPPPAARATPPGAVGGTAASEPAGGATPSATHAPLNLNLATVAELDELPEIGPVLAERIVAHREQIGGFTAVGQLRDVTGIGEMTFQAIAPLVSL